MLWLPSGGGGEAAEAGAAGASAGGVAGAVGPDDGRIFPDDSYDDPRSPSPSDDGFSPLPSDSGGWSEQELGGGPTMRDPWGAPMDEGPTMQDPWSQAPPSGGDGDGGGSWTDWFDSS